MGPLEKLLLSDRITAEMHKTRTAQADAIKQGDKVEADKLSLYITMLRQTRSRVLAGEY